MSQKLINKLPELVAQKVISQDVAVKIKDY